MVQFVKADGDRLDEVVNVVESPSAESQSCPDEFTRKCRHHSSVTSRERDDDLNDGYVSFFTPALTRLWN